MDVLNCNNSLLVNAVKELKVQMNTILTCPVAPSVSTPVQPTLPTASSASHPKIADPPKFKGKTQDLTVEQWLQKLSIWFWYQNIVKDKDKITTTLLFLEGGAQSYMDDYAKKAAKGCYLGTWDVFVNWLRSGYQELAPEKSAQQSLEELCTETNVSISLFAENFYHLAIKSSYSDIELIC